MSSSQIQVSDITDEDLRPLAIAHMAAYKGYMNAGIGQRYVRQFLKWYLRDDRVALKAEVDGVPAGYAVGCRLADHARMNSDLLYEYALGAALHPWVLLRKQYRTSAVAKLKRIFKLRRSDQQPAPQAAPEQSPPRDVITLTSIAVDPKFAGRGAGQALMQAFERAAKERGFESAQLSVYADNDRARAVYEKSGWTLTKQDGRVAYFEKRLK